MSAAEKIAEQAEEWRSAVGYVGYEVSNKGRVRSWRPCNRRALPPSEARVLRPTISPSTGYASVEISLNGVGVRRAVHRLVLEAFVGPCPPGMETRHVNDNNRTNNDLTNLAWGTKRENMEDQRLHGTLAIGLRNGNYTKPQRRATGARNGRATKPESTVRGDAHYARAQPEKLARGERVSTARLTEHQVREIRSATGKSLNALAREFGVAKKTVLSVRQRKTWAHVAEEGK